MDEVISYKFKVRTSNVAQSKAEYFAGPNRELHEAKKARDRAKEQSENAQALEKMAGSTLTSGRPSADNLSDRNHKPTEHTKTSPVTIARPVNDAPLKANSFPGGCCVIW
jgi:hypothetical protein